MSNFDIKSDLVVYGRGMLANCIRAIDGISGAFFASGVSDSVGASQDDYNREILGVSEFIKINKDLKIYYFSSFVALSENSRYAEHKRTVEDIISKNAKKYLIVRLPQVVGITKNKTLVSFMISSVLKNLKIRVYKNAKRRLLSIEDFGRILKLLSLSDLDNMQINVGPDLSLSAEDILLKICSILETNPNYELIGSGDAQYADVSYIKKILGDSDNIFQDNYQEDVLSVYVPQLSRIL